MSRPLALTLYGAAMGAFEPFAGGVLRGRARRGKEDLSRLPERLGHASVERPAGPLVWLHGVSVGESLSLLPLIDRIRAERPEIALLITSGTVTSAALLARRLPPGVIHQYAPVDGPRATARFLDHWRPDLGLFAESELWPNLILGARRRGVRLALLSARITERTAKGWAKRRATANVLLSAFELILPQDTASAQRLAGLGARPGPELNLKYVADALPADPTELGRLKIAAAGRKVVVAASTHPGEEALIAAACPAGPMLIIVPRHPDRGAQIAQDLAAMGRKVTRRAAGDALSHATDVYVADTLGELGLFFRLADLVVMGGSLVEGIGGHNPLEPARLTRTVVSGGHVHNFEDVYADMASAKAVWMTGEALLGEDIAGFLANPQGRSDYANAARVYATGLGDAFEAGWTRIAGLLP